MRILQPIQPCCPTRSRTLNSQAVTLNTQTSWTALGLHYAKLWIMRAGAGKSWQGNRSSALQANGDIAWVLEHRRVLLAFLAFVEMQFSCGLRWFIRKAAADLAMWASPKFTATPCHRSYLLQERRWRTEDGWPCWLQKPPAGLFAGEPGVCTMQQHEWAFIVPPASGFN